MAEHQTFSVPSFPLAESMERIIRQIKKSDHVLIASHIHPDGDAIGSLLAMGLALDRLHKKATLYNESNIPTVYRFLPAVERIVPTVEALTYDTMIVLDCGDFRRVGNPVPLASNMQGLIVINIDHHITNTCFGDLRLVDVSACATAELVYRLIKKMDVPIDKAIATSIYTGIFTDTGSFRFSNTNKAAFEICHEMVSVGVDPYHVAKNVYGTYSLARIKLLNKALDSIEISCDGILSVMTVTQEMLDETGTQPEDVDGLINYARRIQNVRMAVLIRERQNDENISGNYHVSLRSDGSVNVASIAADFGGGGHPTAAGFNIGASMSELKRMIFNLAEKCSK